MLRRRLRLCCSSDEEDDAQIQPQENGTVNQGSVVSEQPMTSSPPCSNPNPNTNNEPVQISDDEFIDVSDITPPSPPSPDPPPSRNRPQPQPHQPQSQPQQPQPQLHQSNSFESTGSPIGDFLWRMGLGLRREWLESCLGGLSNVVPGFSSLGVMGKAKLCFEQVLFADMNNAGAGVLPPDVGSMHLVDLPGPFVLQVDEIVNISCPLRVRYQDVPPGFKRCLKLSMTDGVQRIFGMEYRPIKDLKVLSPAGLKVSICNVHIRHGLLMLVPEVLEVLGGMVEDLDEARKRLVDEVNKPPRGKRSRTGAVPSLATRATRAAWHLNNANVNGTESSTLEEGTPIQTGQGDTSVASRTNTGQRTLEQSPFSIRMENVVSHASSSFVSHVEAMHIDTVPRSREAVASNLNVNNVRGAEDIHVVASRNDTSQKTTHGSSISTSPGNHGPHSSSNVFSHVEEMSIDTAPINRNASVPYTSNVPNLEDIQRVVEVEGPLLLPRSEEIPFTYLSSLSAKWEATKDKASSIEGKIRCFLTGVKRFNYKRRTTYELQCYVDDGSLISEILIDHAVVQNGIGHSPVEVSAALSSSDAKRVSGMKETLKQFQILLVNFEGTMIVEMNKTSPLPVALEMSQGCTSSDAWLLLKRINSLTQTSQHRPSEPIDLSP